MNFLSHYYIDRIENKPYHNFGLILPDLMSMYKRKWKVSSRVMKENLTLQETQIVTGVVKHNNLDGYFHNSDFFYKYTTAIKEILQKNGVRYPEQRIHFVAHILLELLVDRVIIKKEKLILKEFYSELDQIDWNVLNDFLVKIKLDAVEGFYGYFVKFRRRKYLYKYANNFQVLFITNRILEKVNLPQIVDQKRLMKKCLNEIEAIINESYYEVTSLRSRMILHNYSKQLSHSE